MIIRLEEVILCDMEETVPTVLIFDGRRYVLQEPDVVDDQGRSDLHPEKVKKPKEKIKLETPEVEFPAMTIIDNQLTPDLPKITKELNNLAKERKQSMKKTPLQPLGKPLARSHGVLIYENPLNNMLDKPKLTHGDIETILRTYHDLKPSTITNYAYGYSAYINKDPKADIRSNEVPITQETVTEKDRTKVKKIVSEAGDKATFDNILKEVDMTSYKLGLILNESEFQFYEDNDGKVKYRNV